ncbi:MAG: exosortase/archaeosortase family protein [Armatimonadetes bacterium]|nr:exosortase/archaeosortase family protein [Armatimonadota bacterium]
MYQRNEPWVTALPFAVAGALLIVLARPMLAWWWWEWVQPESYYAHAPIIPFLAALMLWHRREALRAVPKSPCPAALLLLVPALALLVLATKTELEAVESLAFFLTLWGAVWLTLGTRLVRAAAFPLAFLALMAPLPGPVLNDATLRLQMLSTALADRLLHLLTFPTTLHGNVIRMENFDLFVDVPCSGFKLLLSLLTFSAAFAFLVDGAPRKRLALFLFSLPLAVVVNAVRVALIGVVGDCISPAAAHVFHDWSGMITLTLGFVALFSLAKGLGCRKFAGWAIF